MNNRLAISGGEKTIDIDTPHFKWPPITKDLEKAVLNQLRDTISIYDRSGIFLEFENNFAKYHNRKYSLLCNSGTTAIHSMYVALGLEKGDEVICPAYTFFATVSPLLFTGAVPVLCDCTDNGNIDPIEIKKKLTNKTKAIIVTHMWGVPCDMDEIMNICKEHNLFLLEDCSHAHGALYKGKKIGSFGDISAWSLQGAKNISGGEGGILTTNNEEFYYRALMLGHYNKRCRQEIPKNSPLYKYAVTGMGLKYRAHPLAIQIALNVFNNYDTYLHQKNIFAKKIVDKLLPYKALIPQRIPVDCTSSWYALVFQYDSKKMDGLSLDKFCEALHCEGLCEVDIPTSTVPLNLLPLFQDPNDLFPEYARKFSYKEGDFPMAEKFYKNAIKLPVWGLPNDYNIVDGYINGFIKVLNHFHEI